MNAWGAVERVCGVITSQHREANSLKWNIRHHYVQVLSGSDHCFFQHLLPLSHIRVAQICVYAFLRGNPKNLSIYYKGQFHCSLFKPLPSGICLRWGYEAYLKNQKSSLRFFPTEKESSVCQFLFIAIGSVCEYIRSPYSLCSIHQAEWQF